MGGGAYNAVIKHPCRTSFRDKELIWLMIPGTGYQQSSQQELETMPHIAATVKKQEGVD